VWNHLWLAAMLSAALLGSSLGTAVDSPVSAEEGIVVADQVRLRDDVWGRQVGLLRDGQSVTIQSTKPDAKGETWYLVKTGEETGWVSGAYVRPEPSSRSGRSETASSATDSTNYASFIRSVLSLGVWQAPANVAGRTVGVQVGHWRNSEAGYPYNTQSGSSWGGHVESEVNLAIAQRIAARLSALGCKVDLLPTVIPSGYRADVVVAVHADGGPSSRRGFFADRSADNARVPLSTAESRLVSLLDQEYGASTGIPYVYRGTVDSRYYYGYYYVSHETPMALIETGFLTNAEDRKVILDQPDLAARGIAEAIELFLAGR